MIICKTYTEINNIKDVDLFSRNVKRNHFSQSTYRY